jgi:hypothetical protein
LISGTEVVYVRIRIGWTLHRNRSTPTYSTLTISLRSCEQCDHSCRFTMALIQIGANGEVHPFETG